MAMVKASSYNYEWSPRVLCNLSFPPPLTHTHLCLACPQVHPHTQVTQITFEILLVCYLL